MQLPIPIFIQEKIYTGVEIKRPTTEIIAITKEKMQEEKYFFALLQFVSGCILSINTDSEVITDKERIKNICYHMPQVSIEYLSIQIMLLYDSDDGIEGYFSCPRCQKEQVAELKDGIDTRDFISQLSVGYLQNLVNLIEVNLDYPFEIIIKETTYNFQSFSFRFPTVQDYIEAESMFGIKNQIKIMLHVYKKCLVNINGLSADISLIKNLGDLIIKRIDSKDLNRITKKIKEYGLNNKVKKSCSKCNKEWEEEINTNNFFASGLLSS